MELVRTTAIRRNPASPLIEYALRAWVESGAAPPAADEAPRFRGSAPVSGFRRKPETGVARQCLVASSLLTKEKGHPKLDVLMWDSHRDPALRSRWESEEKVRPAYEKSPKAFFIALGLFLSWSGQRGSNSLPPPWQGGALPDELCPRNKGYFSKGMSPCQVFVFRFSEISSSAVSGSGVSVAGGTGWASSSAPSRTNSIRPAVSSAG